MVKVRQVMYQVKAFPAKNWPPLATSTFSSLVGKIVMAMVLMTKRRKRRMPSFKNLVIFRPHLLHHLRRPSGKALLVTSPIFSSFSAGSFTNIAVY